MKLFCFSQCHSW